MAATIKFEIWDASMKKCQGASSFETVDAFVAEAMKFKNRKDSAILRVHIPGSVSLSNADVARIDSLGITLF